MNTPPRNVSRYCPVCDVNHRNVNWYFQRNAAGAVVVDMHTCPTTGLNIDPQPPRTDRPWQN